MEELDCPHCGSQNYHTHDTYCDDEHVADGDCSPFYCDDCGEGFD